MKKLLLGTTALIAAGAFVVTAAQAGDDEMMEEAATLTISGYSLGIVGFSSNDTDSDGNPVRGDEIFHVTEFDVAGSVTLDNGITVTGYAQVGSHNPGITETHLTMSGAFGSLRIGETESAAFASTVAAPGGGGISVGVNYPWYSPAAPAVNTYSGLGTEDAIKLVYTSPNFNGLSIGLSYAPEASAKAAGAGRRTNDPADDDGNFQVSEHAAVGVSYSTSFMEGGSLSLGLGFEQGVDEGGGDDPSAMKAGAVVSIDQLSFGGGMYDEDGAGMQYDVGASWTEGPTALGVQYGHNETGDTSMTALHLTYTLGTGVTVGGQIAAGSSAGAEDATQILLGTSVSF